MMARSSFVREVTRGRSERPRARQLPDLMCALALFAGAALGCQSADSGATTPAKPDAAKPIPSATPNPSPLAAPTPTEAPAPTSAPPPNPAVATPPSLVVEISNITTQASYPHKVIREVLGREQQRFEDCYRQALERTPELEGTLVFDFELSTSGTDRVRGSSPDAADGPLLSCFARGVSRGDYIPRVYGRRVPTQVTFRVARGPSVTP